MAYQPVGDTLALCTFAYKLYNDVWCSAKRAPQDVRDLVDEFNKFRQLLWLVQERPRGKPIQAAIDKCSEFLHGDFHNLCIKYEKLASADDDASRNTMLRLKYAAQKKDVKACQTRLRELIQDIQFFLNFSAEPSVTYNVLNVDRIPGYGASASLPARQSALTKYPGHAKARPHVSSLPSSSSSSNPSHRRDTVSSIPDSAASSHYDQKSSRPKSQISSEGPDDGTSSTPATTVASPRARADSPSSEVEASPISSPTSVTAAPKTAYPKTMILSADALSPLEQSSPISLPQEITNEFEENLAHLRRDNESLEQWIFLAAWWLLKARRIQEGLELLTVDSSEAQYLAHQCSLDIAKSSFLIQHTVIPHLNPDSEITFENWVLVQNLAKALKEEENLDIAGGSAAKSKALESAYRLTEKPVQPIEEASKMPAAMDEVRSTKRWLNIDHTQAGGVDGENVLFRTFINAQIGSKGEVIMTENFPYLLILASKSRGKLVIFLENQLGTVKLSKQLTHEDIHASENLRGSNEDIFEFPTQTARIQYISAAEREMFWIHPRKHMNGIDEYNPRGGEFPLFQGEVTSIHSKSRFEGSDKFVSFDRVSTPGRSFAVTLYELLPEQPEDYWQLTRRLAMCTLPGESDPWAMSWWLPPTNVTTQISNCEIKMEYSDFRHLRHRSSDGKDEYEFVHRLDKPNASISLTFRTPSEASEFQIYILQPYQSPFENPNIVKRLGLKIAPPGRRMSSGSTAQPLLPSNDSHLIKVLNIEDYEAARPSIYSAILYTKRHIHGYKMTELSFAYQHLDFDIHPNIPRITFRHLWTPQYSSNMRKMPYDPLRRKGREYNPGHEKTNKVPRDQHIVFSRSSEVADFMLALTNHVLVFCQAASSISLRSSGGLGLGGDKLEDVVVMLWLKQSPLYVKGDSINEESSEHSSRESLEKTGRKLQLTVRSRSAIGAPWRTTTIERSIDCSKDLAKNGIVLRQVKYQTGTEIDLKRMLAHNSNEPKLCRLININFDNEAAMKEFYQTVLLTLSDDAMGRRFTVN